MEQINVKMREREGEGREKAAAVAEAVGEQYAARTDEEVSALYARYDAPERPNTPVLVAGMRGWLPADGCGCGFAVL